MAELQRDPIDERIDRLTENVNKLIEESERDREEAKELGLRLTENVNKLREESKELGIRFGYYQQSTQAVVNLAFSLVASATISVFITTVLKR